MTDDHELLSIFWGEVGEYLNGLNANLLQLETTKPDSVDLRELLREMNRVAHSMKGAARAVGLGVIETLGHYLEEVFGAAMSGALRLTADINDTLYDALDLIQQIADGEDADEAALTNIVAALEQTVARSATGTTFAANGSGGTNTVELETQTGKASPDARREELTEDSSEIPVVRIDEGEELPAKPAKADIRRKTGKTPVVPQKPPAPGTSLHSFKPPSKDVKSEVADLRTMVVRPPEDSIRVSVSKLDRLMAEASELLVARLHGEERARQIAVLRRQHNRWQREWRSIRATYVRLVRRLREVDEDTAAEMSTLFKFLEFNQRHLTDSQRQLMQLAQDVANDNTRLSVLADQLQDDISAMRLVPFETILGGFHRMVRDLARDTGKDVMLDVDGAGVEIDKTVLDALKDPLMHLLRNAIDHGIELPAERSSSGKAPTGRINLQLEQRGSEILVRVSDDGRGIDPARVRQVAVTRELMNESDAARLSDDEARNLVFHPGFTTAEHLTALSGRGVGMDVVRDRVENLRGRVSLQSTPGSGTVVTLSVPVSLTRIRCILLRIGEAQFAVPSGMVIRMQLLKRSQVFTAKGREVILLDDRPVPLVSLASVLGLESAHTEQPDADLSVLILRAVDRRVAFEVDFLASEQELVLKSLGRELARARFVAGAALLGTGDVIIVLDANELVRAASGGQQHARRLSPTTTLEIPTLPKARSLRILVVDDSITTRTLEKNILETAGFDVRVAIDGIEAWTMMVDEEFDLIISDVEMPNMDGLELTRRIKESALTRHIPVLLLTSLGKPEQREAGLKAGADAYIIKSQFNQGELLDLIRSVV